MYILEKEVGAEAGETKHTILSVEGGKKNQQRRPRGVRNA